MNRDVDAELRTLFAEIEAPPGLDRWRERIADVHAETCVPEQHEPDHDDADDEQQPADGTNGKVVALPTGRELRPRRRRPRSVAVAAAAAVIVGLGGAVLTTQLLSDAPPADPTMIIDGPDKSISSAPPTSQTDASVSGSSNASTPDIGGENPPDAPRTDPGDATDPGGTGSVAVPGGTPVWGSLVGDPSADNTGVPPGTTLTEHRGDLRITTAGQVVSDLRVTGTVLVDAPYVTLTRVHVVAPNGAPAVRQSGSSLTIENSELSGGSSLIQSTSGLTVRRSRLESGVTLVGGAEIFENYLNTADVLIPSGSRSIQLRTNVMGRVTMNDLDAPIRGVYISNNLLTQVDAPTDASSESIHVRDNRFRSSEPSTGWNPAGADYVWSGNTFAETGATADP